MSNSPLVSYTKISPNRGNTVRQAWRPERLHAIDTISIHCVVGQASVSALGEVFSDKSRKASCQYGIGSDGRIGMYCEEKDRSWCTSSSANDNRAITIECASDTKHPYAINDKVYTSLINLCADICKRNNIKELKWRGDKSLKGQVDKQNITVHRWFANKACPGDYIYNRLGKIADEVNAKLGSGTTTAQSANHSNSQTTPFKVRVKIRNLNYRTQPSLNGVILGHTGIGVFTITETKNGWGKLKSNVGWIKLSYTETLKG